jgi:PAS domain S-box-containing protein
MKNTDVRILIAEDSPTQAERLRYLLEGEKYSVEVARNGKEGLKLARESKPALIISDVLMPDVDGYEFCRNVKADEQLKEIPFILLTSLSDTNDVIRGLQCGADNFITKPYEGEHLLASVRNVLYNNQLRRTTRMHVGVEILFGGQKYLITSERQQILDLLLSTYETAVQKNLDLSRTQEELKRLNENLEHLVEERTAALRNEIAERRRAELHLLEHAVLLDMASDAITIVDQNDVITYWNEGAERLYGWSKTEAIGKNIIELLQPIFPQPLEQIRQEFFRQGDWAGELSHVKRDGTRVTVESRWTLERHDGQRSNSIGIHTDITNRKFLESQLRQSQKMEAIGRLAGGVAHDFNNLLTVIMGRAQLLLGRVTDAKVRRDLDLIRDAGSRAAALTHQLLAFSRKQVLEPRVIDLKALVVDAEKLLIRVIGEDIKLTVRSDPDLGTVKADPGQIEQVIMNLVVNSRDAMPQGGTVTLETANLNLDESYSRQHFEVRPGRYVMLAVSDTGHGMDAETQSKIFEPFFTTKEKDKGTGLGLSTVYGIVQQSGGHIWVYSEPGQGTTFKIYLPRVDEPVETIAQPQSKDDRGTETILLVEDEQAVRELIREILELKGYTVLEAGSADEAIGICDAHDRPIDLVITDVIMPGMNGTVLAGHLRSRLPHAKIIYMSGYTDAGIVDSGLLASGHAFLQKPIIADSLARKVREVLESEATV